MRLYAWVGLPAYEAFLKSTKQVDCDSTFQQYLGKYGTTHFIINDERQGYRMIPQGSCVRLYTNDEWKVKTASLTKEVEVSAATALAPLVQTPCCGIM